MQKITIPIRGMHCASCELLIGKELQSVDGVQRVSVSHTRGCADVLYDEKRPHQRDLETAIKNAGYEVGEKGKPTWFSKDITDYTDLIRAALWLGALYLVANWFGIFDIAVNEQARGGVFIALGVGLVAGISSCMALIGGLVLSLSARHAALHPEATATQKFRPHIFFNLGRIIGYTILGGLIGFVGQVVQPSGTTLGVLTIAVGVVMLLLGLKLIEIFPVLHDKTITLPSGIARFVGFHKEVKEYSHRAALTAGALTFFLPCGFTQAMQVYAISTGSFWRGAAVMGLFAIGTAPGLLGVGGLTAFVKGRAARIFFMAAGLAVIIFGWNNIANGRRLLGGSETPIQNAPVVSGEAQVIRMTQRATGYSPSELTVRVGQPVKWIITSTSQFSCAVSLSVPALGYNRTLAPGDNLITFTPRRVGDIPFSCSMGMFRGVIHVVE